MGSSLKIKLAVSENKADFSVERISDSSSWQISGSNIGTDTLSGFKRLEFEDGVLALDIDPETQLNQRIDCIKQLYASSRYARSCISYE